MYKEKTSQIAVNCWSWTPAQSNWSWLCAMWAYVWQGYWLG